MDLLPLTDDDGRGQGRLEIEWQVDAADARGAIQPVDEDEGGADGPEQVEDEAHSSQQGDVQLPHWLCGVSSVQHAQYPGGQVSRPPAQRHTAQREPTLSGKQVLLPSTVCTLHRGLYTGAQALRLLWLHHASPPTAVSGVHNSPIANATTVLKSELVHYRLHLYNQSGVFYSVSLNIELGHNSQRIELGRTWADR